MFSQGVVPKGRMFRCRTGDRIHDSHWNRQDFLRDSQLGAGPLGQAVMSCSEISPLLHISGEMPRRVNRRQPNDQWSSNASSFSCRMSVLDFEAWPTWRETWASSPCCPSPSPFITRGALSISADCRWQLSKIQWFLLQLGGSTVVY